jgi:hypothetical protein
MKAKKGPISLGFCPDRSTVKAAKVSRKAHFIRVSRWCFAGKDIGVPEPASAVWLPPADIR